MAFRDSFSLASGIPAVLAGSCRGLFRDAMRKTADPAERDKAEDEYRNNRKRIEDDRDRAIESIHGGRR